MNETLTQFLTAWKERDWPTMATLTQLTWRDKHADPAAWLQTQYSFKRLQSFEVKEVAVISPTASRVTVKVRYRLSKASGFGGQQCTRLVEAMVIREKAPYEPSEQGVWGVNPVSVLRESDVRKKAV